MSGWQPIETAPKTGRLVILFKDINFAPVRICYWDAGAWCLLGFKGAAQFKDPTHWMPIPEPPAQEQIGADEEESE